MQRRNACKFYNTRLNDIKGIQIPILSGKDDDVNHLYMIRVKEDFEITRDELFFRVSRVHLHDRYSGVDFFHL